jgi:two-component system nitrogen regulation sensor histidine kinase NtrY
MNFKKLNMNYLIGFITFLSLLVGFLTIQTFAGKGLLELNSLNIQVLLVINLVLLSIFLSFVIFKFFRLFTERKSSNLIGANTKKKFLIYFISLSAVPGIVIAIFSLLIFNYSIEKWFDKKINETVTNSVEIAKEYLREHQSSISKDILLIANDFSRNSKRLINNINDFEKYIQIQSNVRSIKNIFIVSDKGILTHKNPRLDIKKFNKPDVYILTAAKKGKPVIISSAYTNKTYGMVKLRGFKNSFLYVIQDVDPKIVNYIKKTGKISEYYFNIKNNIFNLQITFTIIYIIITLLLIFVASIVSINLSSYISKPLTYLFDASSEVEKGNYSIHLKNENLDSDFSQLYTTFNNMIKRIKDDQTKKSQEGRYEAWKLIAKKLAHEIKNPLTPIQLSLDRIDSKFKKQIVEDKTLFEDHIKTINLQISEITNLLNSFSEFARMPDPEFSDTNIIELIDRAVLPYKTNYKQILITINSSLKSNVIKCDKNQTFRLFTNLIKNSVESIVEKNENKGKVEILIQGNDNSVDFLFQDNGIGFELDQMSNISEPYFTTKQNGSGLGLSIVSKIIFEHKGNINFYNSKNGANIHFTFNKHL